MADRHYDACSSCGERKKKTSLLCRRCSNRERFKPVRSKVLSLNYFPRDGRYALLAVSGYAHENGGRWSTTLAVLDSHNCWKEVRVVQASGPHVKRKRDALVKWCRDQNWAER